MKTAIEYTEAPFTPEADELFDSPYSTRDLAFELANAISIKSNDPYRMAFLAEAKIDEGFTGSWYRGNICRALADLGETVSRINRRRW